MLQQSSENRAEKALGIAKTVQFVVVATLVFSVWVAFALLVVNPYLHPYVPGYQVGRPCGWEFVALAVSLFTSYYWTKNWEGPISTHHSGKLYIGLNSGLVIFLILYLVAAVAVFVWQYAEYSAGFS
ncbi:MAG: hypothetical protein HKN85_05510 [Gammaproteobacteria bacterium]|nr:hypothetical protein [Gammaproteobacteria bacterium]